MKITAIRTVEGFPRNEVLLLTVKRGFRSAELRTIVQTSSVWRIADTGESIHEDTFINVFVRSDISVFHLNVEKQIQANRKLIVFNK